MSAAKSADAVAGVAADHHRAVGRRCVEPGGHPAVARRTSARFMRFGPAPARRAARRCRTASRSPKRSRRPAASPAASSASSSAAGDRVGVLVAPGLGRAGASTERRRRSRPPAHSWRRRSRSPMRSAAGRPASSTSAWSRRRRRRPAARLVTSESPSTSAPSVAGGDHLVHRRHADEVGAERLQHADLGRRLVLRPGEPGVDALVERRVDARGPARGAGGRRRR